MKKRYEELTFADDFLFCKIMQSNPELCRELTQLILGKRIGKIIKLNKQHPIEITADGRGVRFDIYMEDDANTVYNIEMQAGTVTNIAFRTRYYQGMIDLDQIERGARFQDLRKTYIIFICLENPFPEIGLHKYSFRSVCAEQPQLELGDGVQKVLISASGTQEDVSEDLKSFLNYVAGKLPESDLTRKLEEVVAKAREHIEWRKEYMTLLEIDERMREEGREEGIKEGRAKEHLNSLRVLVQILTKYTENENDLLEEIMKHPEYSDITPDEIRAILEECGCIDK